MVGSWCSEDGEGGDKENGEGEFCTHPPPPPFSGGCLREGSPVHTKGAVYCCRVKKKWALQVSVMFLLTSAGYRHTNFWQKLPLLVIFYYQDPQNSPLSSPTFLLWSNVCFFQHIQVQPKSASQAAGWVVMQYYMLSDQFADMRVVYWSVRSNPTPRLFLSEDNKASRK